MGSYHFHLTQIKRSACQSAIASAAYRAGEKLYSTYYGEISDYTRKGGVVLSEIMLPPHAPPRFNDRETLWNEVEWAEPNKKAQLAHSFDIAMMNEFSMEENIALARDFIQEHLVSRGMIVDFAIHDPPRKEGEPRNPHIHIMVPIRPLNADGTWGIKQKKLPLLDADGNIIMGKNGKPLVQAVPTTDWSKKETLLELRKAWGEMNNELYEKKGMTTRVEWRSYEELGIDMLPMVHEGAAVRAMEEKGIRTELGTLNRAIRAVNAFLARAKRLIEWVSVQKKQLTEAISEVPEPTLAGYLLDYYDRRNKVAETYKYGTEKAKHHNLKDFASTINFLTEENIKTPSELEGKISLLSADLKKVQKRITSKAAETKKLRDLLKAADNYQKYRPIKEQYDKKIFGKGSFYQKHEKALKRYYAAERKLQDYMEGEGNFPTGVWEKRIGELGQSSGKLKAERDALKKKLNSFERVKRCIEIVQGNETSETQKANENEQKRSIRDRLDKNREKIDSQGRKHSEKKQSARGEEL